MPFCLKNGLETFQQAMNVILASVRWQFSLFYLDDIAVFSKSLVDHIEHVRRVSCLRCKAECTLNLKICMFFTETIDYLGDVIRPDRLELAERTTDAVEQWEKPMTWTELRSFIVICNVFRLFVPKFARLAVTSTKVEEVPV